MEVSLILPIYKAESFLEQNLQEIDRCLSGRSESWELVLVVDGSPDQSYEVCQRFANQPRSYSVQVLLNEKNRGKGYTVKRGMLAAQGAYRIFTDCDLAYPMVEVLKVLDPLREGKDISVASRGAEGSHYIFGIKHIRHIYMRHLISRVFNRLVNAFLPMNCKDTQAGLKGFRAQAAHFIFSQTRLEGFSFDVEVLHIAKKAGFTLEEVPIYFHFHPSTTMSVSGDGYKMFKDVLKVRRWIRQGCYELSQKNLETSFAFSESSSASSSSSS
ncbi:MAG: glycosyltransferase [Deltaproteobacteria bacterium]|nr:glycosyltransferase [Deltaproteobacteria bacterium]